ncbi:MAG: hypothetical protein R2857_09315 [Vampirovibrionales bacterium]
MTYNSYKSITCRTAAGHPLPTRAGQRSLRTKLLGRAGQTNFLTNPPGGQSEGTVNLYRQYCAGAYNSDADLADYADGLTLAMIENNWPVLRTAGHP